MVVDGMEAPQKGHSASSHGPEADLAHHQRRHRAPPDRPTRGRRCEDATAQRRAREGHQRQQRGQQQAGEEAADEKVFDVAGEALAEDLSSVHREQPFQRQEDHGEQQQPRPEPDRAEQERVEMLGVEKCRQRRCPDLVVRRLYGVRARASRSSRRVDHRLSTSCCCLAPRRSMDPAAGPGGRHQQWDKVAVPRHHRVVYRSTSRSTCW